MPLTTGMPPTGVVTPGFGAYVQSALRTTFGIVGVELVLAEGLALATLDVLVEGAVDATPRALAEESGCGDCAPPHAAAIDVQTTTKRRRGVAFMLEG
jgi:hypothetical protein